VTVFKTAWNSSSSLSPTPQRGDSLPVSRNGITFTFFHPQGTLADDLSTSYSSSTALASFHLDDGTTVSFTTEANTPSLGFTRDTATATGTIPARLFVDVRVTVT